MSTTRRTILGGALAAPLLAQFTGAAHGATVGAKWGTISKAWVELRWTSKTQALFEQFEVTVEPIPPAKLTMNKDGNSLRLPVRSGTGDPALANLAQAQGSGLLDGGLVVGTPSGEFRVTELQSMLRDEQVSGTCAVNGVDVGPHPVFTCALAENRPVVEPMLPGTSLKIRLTGLRVFLTQETLDAFAVTFGASGLTTDTVLAEGTAEGVYTPPQP